MTVRRALSVLTAATGVLTPMAAARPIGARVQAPRAVFADSTFASPHGLRAAGAGSARGRNHPNRVFAGYVTSRSGQATVRARLRVPRFICSGRERAISPGVFLLSGPTDHEYFNAANIILGCFRGRPVTEEALVINDAEKDSVKRLHPGDIVLVSVTDAPTGTITVEVKDVTEDHRFDLSFSARGAAAQAELVGDWGSVDSSTGQPVAPPRFAPTTFHSSRVNRSSINALRPAGFDMAAADSTIQISAGPLIGPQRDSFTCRRRG